MTRLLARLRWKVITRGTALRASGKGRSAYHEMSHFSLTAIAYCSHQQPAVLYDLKQEQSAPHGMSQAFQNQQPLVMQTVTVLCNVAQMAHVRTANDFFTHACMCMACTSTVACTVQVLRVRLNT